MSCFLYEREGYEQGHHFIAGVDEVGRGSLAGPVVAVACILSKDLKIEGIKDSKKLTPKAREALCDSLVSDPDVFYGIGIVDCDLIDKMNILRASLHAMVVAVGGLAKVPDYLLVDGNHLPPLSIPSKAVIKGDCHSVSIGAASIIAKHKRDRLMIDYHEKYPQYHFDKHKGYGTKIHIEALKRYGPCPIHRISFAPVKSLTFPLPSVINKP